MDSVGGTGRDAIKMGEEETLARCKREENRRELNRRGLVPRNSAVVSPPKTM